MNKNKLIPIFAAIFILIGVFTSLYVSSTQVESDQIKVNGKEYTIDQLFEISEKKLIETDSGIALDDLMISTGVENLGNYEYTIVGADGYQKTVTWENMLNGILTKERVSIFSDLPKAFKVKDIVAIEVE